MSPFLLRLPRALRDALGVRAKEAGLSLNSYCVRRLAAPETAAWGALDVARLIDRAGAIVGEHLIGAVGHGSTARGEARVSSDLDVLIVVAHTCELTRALYRRWDSIETGGDQRVDAHFVHLPERRATASGLWCEAAIEGVVLADPEGVVTRALIDVRRAIAAGTVVRRRAHGQPYWTAA